MGFQVGSSPEEAAVSASSQCHAKWEWVWEPGKGHVGAALWCVPHVREAEMPVWQEARGWAHHDQPC